MRDKSICCLDEYKYMASIKRQKHYVMKYSKKVIYEIKKGSAAVPCVSMKKEQEKEKVKTAFRCC